MIQLPAQVVQKSARRKRPRARPQERVMARRPLKLHLSLRSMGRLVGLVTMAVLVVAAYKPVVTSSVFELKHVRVVTGQRVRADQIEALVRRQMGASVYGADLDELRQTLQQQPLVEDVIVARLLPDTIRVTVIERQPVAVVKLGDQLVCVDKNGHVIGEYHLMESHPPLLGWTAANTTASRLANLNRLRLYLELKQALSGMKRNYWNEVSEVDIHDVRNVVIRLNATPMVPIHLGHQDFARRLSQALRILDDVHHGKLKASHIDVSDPSRMIVGQSQPDSLSSRRAAENAHVRQAR
ncbi:MAG: FtsQ-type POTRA domain-containing protein [Acidobacteriota bacterium]|nr:FtsQ-type POTRA domain-containing protein [Acidobacteriota bacterium]